MNKKVIFAALGGTITLFLLGGLVFGLLLQDYMESVMQNMGDCAKSNPSMLNIVLANLSVATLISIVFSKINVSTFTGGLVNALWMGALIMLWFDLWMITTFQFMTSSLFIFDFISNTSLITLAGGVIGWILGKVK